MQLENSVTAKEKENDIISNFAPWIKMCEKMFKSEFIYKWKIRFHWNIFPRILRKIEFYRIHLQIENNFPHIQFQTEFHWSKDIFYKISVENKFHIIYGKQVSSGI